MKRCRAQDQSWSETVADVCGCLQLTKFSGRMATSHTHTQTSHTNVKSRDCVPTLVPGPGLVPGPWSRLGPGPGLVPGPRSVVPGPMVPGPMVRGPGPWSLVHGPWSLVHGTGGPSEPRVFHQSAPYESYGGIRTTIRRRISIRIILDRSRVKLKPPPHQKLKKTLKKLKQSLNVLHRKS